MKTVTLLIIFIAYCNAQGTKKGTQIHLDDQCPSDICTCETVQDHIEPTVIYRMATCTKVPSHLHNSFRFLKVNGEIDVITENMITVLGTNIRKLDFSNCKIMRIEKGAFTSLLKHLKSLKLSNNKLTELDKDIFYCPNLEELFLDGNDLRRIHNDTFEQLKNLSVLYLQHNMLQKFTSKLPETLVHLDLYDNEIQSLELNLHEIQLRHLDICGNRFQQFPLKAPTTKRINLKSLCLSDKASHLPEQFATRFTSLTNLTLQGSIFSKSELDVRTEDEIKKLTNITNLSIGYFHIENLEFITNKYNLTNLVLTNITVGNMAKVQNAFRTVIYLNLLNIDQSPDLVKLILGDGSVISQLTRLQYLSIQNTKLISIAKHNVPKSVVKLNIANNPLRCDCKLSWIVAKHKESTTEYLQDVAHTTCSTPAQFDEQQLTNVVKASCSVISNGMLEQDISNTNSTSEGQNMQTTDHTVLYIILGTCLVILLVIGITLAIVLSIMKKKRRHQIAPEGGQTPMEQQQIKQSSSHDMLLKK